MTLSDDFTALSDNFTTRSDNFCAHADNFTTLSDDFCALSDDFFALQGPIGPRKESVDTQNANQGGPPRHSNHCKLVTESTRGAKKPGWFCVSWAFCGQTAS